MGEAEYVGKLWDLANAVTAFALLQLITLLTASATNRTLARKMVESRPLCLLAVLLGNAIYIAALFVLRHYESGMLADAHDQVKAVTNVVFLGRVALLSLATAGTMLAIANSKG